MSDDTVNTGYTGSSKYEDSAICAISLADNVITIGDMISELKEEIDSMKKEFEELRADCIPESTRRIRGIMREMDFYKDEDDSDNKELPTLKTPEPEFMMEDDCDFDDDIELEDIGEIPFHPENYSGEFDD